MVEGGLQFIAVGLMAFGMLGAALAIGNVFAAFISSVARNPETEDKLSKYVYVGAGLSESIGIFSLVIALILIFS